MGSAFDKCRGTLDTDKLLLDVLRNFDNSYSKYEKSVGGTSNTVFTERR